MATRKPVARRDYQSAAWPRAGCGREGLRHDVYDGIPVDVIVLSGSPPIKRERRLQMSEALTQAHISIDDAIISATLALIPVPMKRSSRTFAAQRR